MKSSYHRIWEIVCRIPRGKVATYGGVAARCGLDGHARLVGYALHNLPEGIDVPWHRVVNSRGKISFPLGSRQYAKQKRLLEAERVHFVDETIDLGRFGWGAKRNRKVL